MIYLCSISTKASTASKQQQGKTKKWLEIHPNKKREKKHNYFADCQMSPKFFSPFNLSKDWTSKNRSDLSLWTKKCTIAVSSIFQMSLRRVRWDKYSDAENIKRAEECKNGKGVLLLLSELQYWLSQWLLMSKLNNLYEKKSLWKIRRNFPSTKHTSFFS